MPWITVTITSIHRYFEYLWGGLKARWASRYETGLWPFLKGIVRAFPEAFAMVQMDIKQGYISV